jgi:hypothetical protein
MQEVSNREETQHCKTHAVKQARTSTTAKARRAFRCANSTKGKTVVVLKCANMLVTLRQHAAKVNSFYSADAPACMKNIWNKQPSKL